MVKKTFLRSLSEWSVSNDYHLSDTDPFKTFDKIHRASGYPPANHTCWITNTHQLVKPLAFSIRHGHDNAAARQSACQLMASIFQPCADLTAVPLGHKRWTQEVKRLNCTAQGAVPLAAHLHLKSAKYGTVTPDDEELTNTYGPPSSATLKASERNFLNIYHDYPVYTDWYDELNTYLPRIPDWWTHVASHTAARAIFQFRACRAQWMTANSNHSRTRGQRTCPICQALGVRQYDDEFHVLMNCPLSVLDRDRLLHTVVCPTLDDIDNELNNAECLTDATLPSETHQPRTHDTSTPLSFSKSNLLLLRIYQKLISPTTPTHAKALAGLLTRARAMRHVIVRFMNGTYNIPQHIHVDAMIAQCTKYEKMHLPHDNQLKHILRLIHSKSWLQLQSTTLQTCSATQNVSMKILEATRPDTMPQDENHQ
jgi:hypothetical protein